MIMSLKLLKIGEQMIIIESCRGIRLEILFCGNDNFHKKQK
jgi:hypothetical protein